MPRPSIEPGTQTHTLCEPAQSKRMSKFHRSHFIQKFARKMQQLKTTAHTLCEPAQSKRMSIFHKSHPMQKFARKNVAPQNLGPHFTRAILYKNFTIRATLSRNLQEKCRAPESAQNADTHFVRACAVDMHVNISQ